MAMACGAAAWQCNVAFRRADAEAAQSARSTAWQRPAVHCRGSGRAVQRSFSGCWLLLVLLYAPHGALAQTPGVDEGPIASPMNTLRIMQEAELIMNSMKRILVNIDTKALLAEGVSSEATPVDLQKGCVNVTQAIQDRQARPETDVPSSSSPSSATSSSHSSTTLKIGMTASLTGSLAFKEAESLKNALALSQYMSKYKYGLSDSTHKARGWAEQRPLEFCLVDDQSNKTLAKTLYSFFASRPSNIHIVFGPTNIEWRTDIALITDPKQMFLMLWSSPASFYDYDLLGGQQPNFSTIIRLGSQADLGEGFPCSTYQNCADGLFCATDCLNDHDNCRQAGLGNYCQPCEVCTENRISVDGTCSPPCQATTLGGRAPLSQTPDQGRAPASGQLQGPSRLRRLTNHSLLSQAAAAGIGNGTLLQAAESALSQLSKADACGNETEGNASTNIIQAYMEIYPEGSAKTEAPCCTGTQNSRERRQNLTLDECQPNPFGPYFRRVSCKASGLIEIREYLDCACEEDITPTVNYTIPSPCQPTDCHLGSRGLYQTGRCNTLGGLDTFFHPDAECALTFHVESFRNNECRGPIPGGLNLAVPDFTDFFYVEVEWQGFCDASDSQTFETFCDQCNRDMWQPLKNLGMQDFCDIVIASDDQNFAWNTYVPVDAGACHACKAHIVDACYNQQPQAHVLAIAKSAVPGTIMDGALSTLPPKDSKEKVGVLCCTGYPSSCTEPPQCKSGCQPLSYYEAQRMCQELGMYVCYTVEVISNYCTVPNAYCDYDWYWTQSFLIPNHLQAWAFLVSETEHCANGHWKDGSYINGSTPEGRLEQYHKCMVMLAKDPTCSTEWFGVGSHSGQCWCVDRGDNCTVRQARGQEDWIYLMQVSNHRTGPRSCPSGSFQVSKPVFNSTPATVSSAYTLNLGSNTFRLPKGVKDLFINVANNHPADIRLFDESNGQTVAKGSIGALLSSDYAVDQPTSTASVFYSFAYKDSLITATYSPLLSSFDMLFAGTLPVTLILELDVKAFNLGKEAIMTYSHSGISNFSESSSGCQSYYPDECWLRWPQCVESFMYGEEEIATGSGCTNINFGLQGWCSHTAEYQGLASNCTNVCVEGYPICPLGWRQVSRLVFPCDSSASEKIFPRQVQVELVGGNTSTDIVEIPTNISNINISVAAVVGFDLRIIDLSTDQYLVHRTLGVINRFYGFAPEVAVYKGLRLSQTITPVFNRKSVSKRCNNLYRSIPPSDFENDEQFLQTCLSECRKDHVCKAVNFDSLDVPCNLSSLCDSKLNESSGSHSVYIKTVNQTVRIQGQVGPEFQLELSVFSAAAGAATVSYISGDISPCPVGMYGVDVPPGCEWIPPTVTTTTTTTEEAKYVECPTEAYRNRLVLVGCIGAGAEATKRVAEQETFLIDANSAGTIMEIVKGTSDVMIKATSSDATVDLALVHGEHESVMVGNDGSIVNAQTEGSVMGMDFFWTGADDTEPYESYLRLTGTATGNMKVNLFLGEAPRNNRRQASPSYELDYEYTVDYCHDPPIGCTPYNASDGLLVTALVLNRMGVAYQDPVQAWSAMARERTAKGLSWSSFASAFQQHMDRSDRRSDAWKYAFRWIDLDNDGFIIESELILSYELYAFAGFDYDGHFWNRGFRYAIDISVPVSQWGRNLFSELWSKGARSIYFIAQISAGSAGTEMFNDAGELNWNLVCAGASNTAAEQGFTHKIMHFKPHNISVVAKSLSRAEDVDVIVFCGSKEDTSVFFIAMQALDMQCNALVSLYPYGNLLSSTFGTPVLRDVLQTMPWNFQLRENVFGTDSSVNILLRYKEAFFPSNMTLSAAQILSLTSILFQGGSNIGIDVTWRNEFKEFISESVPSTLLGLMKFDRIGKRISGDADTATRQFTEYPKVATTYDQKVTRYFTTITEVVENQSASESEEEDEWAALVSLLPRIPSRELRYPKDSFLKNEEQVFVCNPGCFFTLEECRACPPGSYIGQHDLHCRPCEFGPQFSVQKYSANFGASECKPCPEEAVCRASDKVPEAAPGYYRLDLSDSLLVEDNQTRALLLNGAHLHPDGNRSSPLSSDVHSSLCSTGLDYERYQFFKCSPPELCLGNNVCREHNTGYFCSVCADGYSFLGFQRDTHKCSSCTNHMLLVVICVLSVLVYAGCTYCVAHLLERHAKRKNSIVIGAIRILLIHLQLLSIVTDSSELAADLSLYNIFPGPLADFFVTPWLVFPLDCLFSLENRIEMYYILQSFSTLLIPFGIGFLLCAKVIKVTYLETIFFRHKSASKAIGGLLADLADANAEVRSCESKKESLKASEHQEHKDLKLHSSASESLASKRSKSHKEVDEKKKVVEHQLARAVFHEHELSEELEKTRKAESQTWHAMRRELNRKHEQEMVHLGQLITAWCCLSYAVVLVTSSRLISCTGKFDRPRLRLYPALQCDGDTYKEVYWWAFVNFILVGIGLPAALFAVMIVCVFRYDCLNDLYFRRALGLLFLGFQPACWFWGTLDFAMIFFASGILTITDDFLRSAVETGLLVLYMAINFFCQAYETNDREGLGSLNLYSCSVLVSTAVVGQGLQFRREDSLWGTAYKLMDHMLRRPSLWVNILAVLNILVLLSGLFVIMYNTVAIKLQLAHSAGARMTMLQRITLYCLRRRYGLRPLTLHASKDDIVIVYDMNSEKAKEFSKSFFKSLRSHLGCPVQSLNTVGAFYNLSPPNILFVITPGVFDNAEAQEALQAAVKQKKNIVFLKHVKADCDLELEVFKCPKDVNRQVLDIFHRKKNVVEYSEDDKAAGMSELLTKLQLRDPKGAEASVEMIDMSSLASEAERQVVHTGMEEIVRACMDCGEYFSPSLCAKSIVLAFQRALQLRGKYLNDWEQRVGPERDRLGPLNHEAAMRSITVDEFYNAVKDVNDDLLSQHPDIVALFVGSPADKEKEDADLHIAKHARADDAEKEPLSEEEQLKIKKAKAEHMKWLQLKWARFKNLQHLKQVPEPGYHCPRCKKSFLAEDAEAQNMTCTCPGEFAVTEKNPRGENMIGKKTVKTPLVPGALEVFSSPRSIWRKEATDAEQVSQDVFNQMHKFDDHSQNVLRRQSLQSRISRAKADVKMLEQRLDRQLRRNARMEQAKSSGSTSNTKEAEVHRLLGRDGPIIETDKATLFSSWAQDGSNAAPSTLFSPRARGIFGLDPAEERRVPLSSWEPGFGFGSQFKAYGDPANALVDGSGASRPAILEPRAIADANAATRDRLKVLSRPTSPEEIGVFPQQADLSRRGLEDVSAGATASSAQPARDAVGDWQPRVVAPGQHGESSGLAAVQAGDAPEVSQDHDRDSPSGRLSVPATAATSAVSVTPAESNSQGGGGTASDAWPSGPTIVQLRFDGDINKVNAGMFRTMLFSKLRARGLAGEIVDQLGFKLLPEKEITVHIRGSPSAIRAVSALGLSDLNVVGCRVTEVKELVTFLRQFV